MLCRLDDLYGCIVTDFGGEVGWQRHLWQTETPVILHIGGAGDLKDGLHVEGVIQRDGAFAQIDVKECGGVTGEPAGLNTDSAAGDGP